MFLHFLLIQINLQQDHVPDSRMHPEGFIIFHLMSRLRILLNTPKIPQSGQIKLRLTCKPLRREMQ